MFRWETCQELDGCARMGVDDKFAIAIVWNMDKQETTTCCWSHVRVQRWTLMMPKSLPCDMASSTNNHHHAPMPATHNVNTLPKENPHPPRHHVAHMECHISPTTANDPSRPRTTTTAHKMTTTPQRQQQPANEDQRPRSPPTTTSGHEWTTRV